MVNRRKPVLHGIDCNSLGYIGQFYVRDENHKDKFMEIKPIEFLTAIAYPIYGKYNNNDHGH
jgi:ATP adenylyltransferase/5',5'''-P-1,P-4-tetraphosphate phosphorylase II